MWEVSHACLRGRIWHNFAKISFSQKVSKKPKILGFFETFWYFLKLFEKILVFRKKRDFSRATVELEGFPSQVCWAASQCGPRAGTRGDRALTQRPAPGPCQAAGVTLSASEGCFPSQSNYSLPVQANLNDFDSLAGWVWLGIRLGLGEKNVCELEESSKELINIYSGTGHQQRRPIFQTGTHLLCHYLPLIPITTITYYPFPLLLIIDLINRL